MSRVCLRDLRGNPVKVNGIPMGDVSLRGMTGNFLLVRMLGNEKDPRGNPVVRDRVVPLSDVATIDYLDPNSS